MALRCMFLRHSARVLMRYCAPIGVFCALICGSFQRLAVSLWRRALYQGMGSLVPQTVHAFFEKSSPRQSCAQLQQEARRPLRQLHHIGLEDLVGWRERLIACVSLLAQEDVNGIRL